MNNKEKNSAESYLLEKLINIEVLNLPVFTAENCKQSSIIFPVSDSDCNTIREMANDKDFNVLKLFISGLSILLWRYSMEENILISLPPLNISGNDILRNGILYCKLAIQKDLIIKDLLVHVHESLNDAHIHGEYNEQLFESRYSAEKDGNLLPIRGVALCYEPITASVNLLSEHSLVFEFIEDESVIKVTSRQPFFPDKMLMNMAESLLLSVLSLSASKDNTVCLHPILPANEAITWENRFLANKREYPDHLTVVDLFLNNVSDSPNSIALVCVGEAMTYSQLDEVSKTIADYLHDRNFSGNVIGIMMDRSILMVATVLGILRSGNAYLPLDKDYPEERVREIITDTQCQIILTGENKDWNFYEKNIYININAVLAFQNHSNSYNESFPDPEDTAYIIYSSGTTGRPKGVMIQHKSILNLLFWYNEKYAIDKSTRIIQLANLTIDIAFQEIFSVLINGLTLYIPVDEERQDKTNFLNFLNTHRINFIQLIPDMLSEYFLDTPKLEFLDRILCGGDKLNDVLKDEIVLKGYQLYNIYGQTETTIDAVGAVCSYGVSVTFNEYVANYDIWVLDKQNQLCPEYVNGEICIGGKGLFKGYINQLSNTDVKLIDHPYTKDEKIYTTGDIGRRFPDGSIQFLGREDDQVKIRGHRIELIEIENIIHQYSNIKAVAVIAKSDKLGQKELVAFIVSSGSLNISEIRNYLLDRLASYMIPSHFIQLEKLPLTSVGKIDKKALLEITGKDISIDLNYVTAGNDIEEKLVQIWMEVLGKDKIGIKDNFFDLGGNSLKIVKMLGLINKVFDQRIPIVTVFKYPTINTLSEYLTSGKENQAETIHDMKESVSIMDETLNILNLRENE